MSLTVSPISFLMSVIFVFFFLCQSEDAYEFYWSFWVKKQQNTQRALGFIDFFLFSTSFISALYYFLCSVWFGFILLFFSSFVKYKLKLLVWDLSSLLINALKVSQYIFGLSHKFWYVVLSFFFSSKFFLISLWIFVYVCIWLTNFKYPWFSRDFSVIDF